MIETDIAIIGGGPGGYVAAIRAAQLKARVVLIEREYLGGTCLNIGCIPSKALLESAAKLDSLREMAKFGIDVGDFTANWANVQARKASVVKTLTSGVAALVKANGITLLDGAATFLAPNRLSVKKSDGSTEEVTAKSVIIATGSTEARPPIPGMDLPGIMTSKEALSIAEAPKSIAIVGGGYIGVEFATIFRAFGAKVTIIEMMPSLIPLNDPELGQELGKQYKRSGIDIRVGTKLASITQSAGGYQLALEKAGENGSTTKETIEAEKVLVAVGRTPNTEGLGIEKLGLTMNRRAIATDEKMRTNLPGVYAIGDVNGKYPLAHVASTEGEVAVENALGHEATMSYRAIPEVIFCSPQVASVGLTEAKAKEAGYDVRVGRFPFAAVSKAVAIGHTPGWIKFVSESRYGQVLGVQMIGPEVTDLLAEAVLAINLETTIEDFAQTIHAHPTLPEGIREAALDVEGRAIHMPPRRR